jgi:hypothetical protein
MILLWAGGLVGTTTLQSFYVYTYFIDAQCNAANRSRETNTSQCVMR